ncbi:hypothetical protein [Sphingomonas turrisvirgatae]|uniref:Uncharacterized protein n=1 Tax=Sphingomonas turrisvirgatae TaxID=1888892 RepID=A0A1E3LTX3_9SPHN|nr:hypothetical protein [Sphingomonas turrisvirgatae]ODP37164.1 hypothetical protein BFL28_02710 [Sphingomonas turrisvirgatae]
MRPADFATIDTRLFERLLWGSLDALRIRLTDGRSVTGQPVALHRWGATGDADAEPAGEIRLIANGETLTLSYDQIADIE